MKLRNLFYLLLALPLVFAACETPDDEKKPDEPKVATLTVKTDAKTFDAEGGSAIVSYTLENAPEGAVVSANCEANWVIELDVTPSSVMFDVKANDSEEPRETKVVISYEEQVFEVPVQQEGKEAVVAPSVPKFELASNELMEFSHINGSGTVYFTLENPVENATVVATSSADWLTISTIGDGTIDFFVDANEGEVERQATITATYGMLDPIVVTVKQACYIDPSVVVDEFVVTECWASSENGGEQWDVTFVEHDATLGDMQTRITFALAEANVQRVTDGTYSVQNGGILLNTATMNGYSTYRHNCSESADILDATFTVATDTNAKTISINGTFKVGDKNIEIKYNGDMRGMDLGEATTGAISYSEWSDVYKAYHDNAELMFYAISADNALNMRFTVKHSGGSKLLPANTYNVEPFEMGKSDYLLDCKATYNNVEGNLVSGSATFEHISGGFKITFDVTDDLGRQFTGTYEGAIRDAVNPA